MATQLFENPAYSPHTIPADPTNTGVAHGYPMIAAPWSKVDREQIHTMYVGSPHFFMTGDIPAATAGVVVLSVPVVIPPFVDRGQVFLLAAGGGPGETATIGSGGGMGTVVLAVNSPSTASVDQAIWVSGPSGEGRLKFTHPTDISIPYAARIDMTKTDTSVLVYGVCIMWGRSTASL